MSELANAKRTFAEEEIGSPKVEALVEAMFLAATSDGSISSEESLQFAATVEALADKKFVPEQIAGLVARLTDRLKQEGRAARLATVAERITGPKARETALILAAAITASDGEIQSGENDLLADLAEALGIDQGRAVELVTRVHRIK